MIYSGDEVGQLNDYAYHSDPAKREDSRYIHRGDFQWELAALAGSFPGRPLKIIFYRQKTA